MKLLISLNNVYEDMARYELFVNIMTIVALKKMLLFLTKF